MADRNGNNDDNFMRPKMGQTFITLPVTFDYSGGRNLIVIKYHKDERHGSKE